MKYKYINLRFRIFEKFDSITKFAEAMGTSQTSISRKLSGRVGFSQQNIEEWAAVLDIPREKYGEYFFT